MANSSNSIISMILQSGFVGLSVVILLVFMSILLWAIVLIKWISRFKESKSVRAWFLALQGHPDLEAIRKLEKTMPSGAFTRLAHSAIVEMEAMAPYVSYASYGPRNQLIEEALQRAIDKEKHHNEKYLSYCAVCSNLGPFLGLFGTVWGIMHSFLDIGKMGSANITVVAPGIAEALITTIFGLIVAIPASAAYNFFVSANRQWESTAYDFASEIVALFKRRELKVLEAADAGNG